MHRGLGELVNKRIAEASSFVTQHMPIHLTADEIYEDLVGEPHILEAFRNAMRYLPPTRLSRFTEVQCGEFSVQVSLKLEPTDKYPVFLWPKYDLRITPESELGQSMLLSIQVLNEWSMLKAAWERLLPAVPDARVLGFLFPWLREIMLDVDFNIMESPPRLKSEREQIEREVRAIQRRMPPSHFPRLSADLNKVCQSGKRLFGQYRMLEAATKDNLVRPQLRVSSVQNLNPAWLAEHLNEAVADWIDDQLEHKHRRSPLGVR